MLPLLATRAGLNLQLDAGIRSHRRRFGWSGGFWLPECAYAPGLEWRLAEHGVQWFCVDQSAHREPLEALTPVATEAGPVALPIDWEAISWLWSLEGYPSDAAHAQFAGKSLRGMRIWKVGGGAYEPAAAEEAARRQAAEFLADIAARLRRFAEPGADEVSRSPGRRGLAVFAIDTELLGHWWSEGPTWLRHVLDGAAAAGVRLVTVPQGLAENPAVERPLVASTWGEGKDLSTWDCPAVADLTGGRGGWSCGCSRRWRPASAVPPPCGPPASSLPCRPAIGPSSISASRPGTTPTGERRTTRRPCCRP